ncbi:hypothetical protein INR49_015164 [Caranx melampygus]|nr:hypothetical protein INR49_015164 [Caranx melampygus]
MGEDESAKIFRRMGEDEELAGPLKSEKRREEKRREEKRRKRREEKRRGEPCVQALHMAYRCERGERRLEQLRQLGSTDRDHVNKSRCLNSRSAASSSEREKPAGGSGLSGSLARSLALAAPVVKTLCDFSSLRLDEQEEELCT